jgi:NAD(P)-dependent dehydrogenase (short-subunit alcohol dehydrogenase family)
MTTGKGASPGKSGAAAGWTTADVPDQSGRTVLVTGASSGLGLRSAEAFAAHGARVLLGCRNPAKGEAARAQVAAVASGPAPELVRIDLADLGSVRRAASAVAGHTGRLDVLMNNAGVMAVPLGRTTEGFELQIGTNHLAHYALTGLLLPLLLQAPAARVVSVSSQAHRMGRIRWEDLNWRRKPYSRWRAYGQSKLANLLFTGELDRRADAAGTGLLAVAGHPGYADTHLQTAVHEATGARLRAQGMKVLNKLAAQPDSMGALPQLYAATMPDVIGGEYFGPSGPAEWRGHPRRVGMSKAARDPEAGRRLWELSAELTGITYQWPSPTGGSG